MQKLKTWSASDAHFAAIGEYQAWSKSSPQGAIRALRHVLAGKGEADLAEIIEGEL